jgi:hypothetical protein
MLMQLVSEKETEDFKWWLRLHGYWCTLPNFNPYTISSEPGHDLAGQAASILMGGHGRGDSDLVRVEFFS